MRYQTNASLRFSLYPRLTLRNVSSFKFVALRVREIPKSSSKYQHPSHDPTVCAPGCNHIHYYPFALVEVLLGINDGLRIRTYRVYEQRLTNYLELSLWSVMYTDLCATSVTTMWYNDTFPLLQSGSRRLPTGSEDLHPLLCLR